MTREGPLAFHIVDLPPEGVPVEGEVPFRMLDIAADAVLSFPFPLHFDLTLAPVADGVLVRGVLSGRVCRVCDRCLAEGEMAVEVRDVCHLFEHVAGTVLDLTEALREDIVLAFPQAWLCREDCRGLCPRCGCDLNRERCRCAELGEPETDGDDPWAVLDSFRPDDEGGDEAGPGR